MAAGAGAAIGTALIVGFKRTVRLIGLVIAAEAEPTGDGPRPDKKQQKNDKKKKGNSSEGGKKARKGK